MPAMKRGTTRDGLGVYGPDGVVEYDQSRRWVVFHQPLPAPDEGEPPCPVLEMGCDTSPIWFRDELPFGPDAPDDEVYAALEGVYERGTR